MVKNILNEDFQNISAEGIDLLKEKLFGKTVLITGATGLVGSLITRYLLYLNETYDANICVKVIVRSIDKVKSIYGDNAEDILGIIKGDVLDIRELDGDIDYIFHCASVTASKMMVESPVETILTSIEGTKNILDIAKNNNAKSVVYVSSMEMYGQFMESGLTVKEDDLGFINPLVVRSNYPESKRMCENMCIAYLSEYKVPVKIARLAQTFGAGVLPWEGRVFAQFAKSAVNKEDIVLHTTGKSEGNYCYAIDAVNALMTILLKGTDGEAYNVCNEEMHTTIADMAHMVADEIAGGEIKVVFDIPESNSFGYAPETHMTLSSEKLRGLGWTPRHNLKDAYNRMISFMQN